MKISKERIKHEIAENFADSTSMITLTMPINTAIETIGANMSNSVSLGSRFYNLALVYAGLTRLIKVRDYTKRKLNIDSYSGAIRGLHDLAYGITLGPLVKTGVYLAAGETDWKKIGIGVAGSALMGGTLSVPICWLVDVGRDLWGIKPSVRTPSCIKDKSPRVKKAIALGALALSVAATSALYYNNREQPTNSGIENTLANSQQTYTETNRGDTL